jgi:alpha-ribazole phosphatase
VFTSPLRRGRDVGRWLRRWGWTHRIDPRLLEADFGTWDGRPWSTIGVDAVDAWVRDFADHRPGGGESVREVLLRCRAFLAAHGASRACVVTHGGWISSLDWWAGREDTQAPEPVAARWAPAIGHACRWSPLRDRRRSGSG